MRRLKEIANKAMKEVNAVLVSKLDSKQEQLVADIIEKAVVKALLEGQHRAVDAAINCPEADQDLAHKIAREIRRKNDAMIANLTSLR